MSSSFRVRLWAFVAVFCGFAAILLFFFEQYVEGWLSALALGGMSVYGIGGLLALRQYSRENRRYRVEQSKLRSLQEPYAKITHFLSQLNLAVEAKVKLWDYRNTRAYIRRATSDIYVIQVPLDERPDGQLVRIHTVNIRRPIVTYNVQPVAKGRILHEPDPSWGLKNAYGVYDVEASELNELYNVLVRLERAD